MLPPTDSADSSDSQINNVNDVKFFTLHFSLCNNKARFPYTLIFATSISMR